MYYQRWSCPKQLTFRQWAVLSVKEYVVSTTGQKCLAVQAVTEV